MQHNPTKLVVDFKRFRYQMGSLTVEARKDGPSVWVYRWRETNIDGSRVRRKRVVGSKTQYPTKASAMRAIEAKRLEINSEAISDDPTTLTVNEVIQHYQREELSDAASKSMRTKQVYRHQLENYIAPQWGHFRLKEVKPIAVELWLRSLTLSPGSKAKTKGVMSVLFQHAMRYGWSTQNPIRLVRQGAMPLHEEVVLTAIEVAALLAELRDPFRVLVLLASISAARRGELFGLKWEDVDFENGEIRIVRSLVDQVEGPPKTLASRRAIPMSSGLGSALQIWRNSTDFPANGDWIFASPQVLGARPYWPDALLKRHILPAAKRAGITKTIGYHTFRRTAATLLQSSGASVKTTQDLLRHASPILTMSTYAKAVTADKRIAQDVIAAMFLGAADHADPEVD